MRSGRSGPEATQEIDASDVLEVIQVAPDEAPSSPSLIGVGVDLDAGRYDQTQQIRLAARRRQLSRYVIGAVAGSCLILVASLVKRESAASNAPPHVAASPPAATTARAPRPLLATANIPPPPPAPISSLPPADRVAEESATTASVSGSIRFAAPAKPGWIWLDDKRLTATSAIVSCGTHQVKVGYRAKHAVEVPCGGEVVLSR
jgi:hypothetical protein